MTPYEQSNADLLATIQRLRCDLGYDPVSDETVSTMALFDGLCKVERELRRELSWQGATTKPQAALPKAWPFPVGAEEALV